MNLTGMFYPGSLVVSITTLCGFRTDILLLCRYLAPFVVFEKFRGRGVGRALMDYAIHRADAHDPKETLYLVSDLAHDFQGLSGS